MQVLLGGTFSILHKAHKEMIERGLKLGNLTLEAPAALRDFAVIVLRQVMVLL